MQHGHPALTPSILVLGAGELGLSVVRALATWPGPGAARISVLLRPQAAAPASVSKRALLDELRVLNVATVYADIAGADAQQLAALFQPFDTVVNCTGFVGGPGTQRKLTQAALQAGVARYVPWQFGVDYDQIAPGSGGGIFDEQIAVRAMLRAQQRTAWTIVSTGMFTSFLFEPAFGVVDLARRTVHALGSWDTRVTVTAPEDIGTLTAHMLFTQPAGANHIFFTAGETITYARLAERVQKALQAPVQRTVWTVQQLEQDLARQPDDAMRRYRLAFAKERGVAWDQASTYNARHGIATQDVAAYLQGRQALRAPFAPGHGETIRSSNLERT